MEYTKFAHLYDRFYSKKNYEKEIEFLNNFIPPHSKILDIGCGTGTHASLLEKQGHIIDILDNSDDMLEVAKVKVNGMVYNQDIRKLNITKKYDVIISMFAVINHLKTVSELKEFIKKTINIAPVLIIDLHNPIKDGTKTDGFDNIKRIMSWKYDRISKIEATNITFQVGNVDYNYSREFRIFFNNEIKKICSEINLDVEVYNNYILTSNNVNAKNNQFIIKKK